MAKWLGCDNIEFIWHGEWADPELECGDYVIDYWSIEDFCVTCMQEEGLDHNDDDCFADWVLKNQELLECTIQEFSDARDC